VRLFYIISLLLDGDRWCPYVKKPIYQPWYVKKNRLVTSSSLLPVPNSNIKNRSISYVRKKTRLMTSSCVPPSQTRTLLPNQILLNFLLIYCPQREQIHNEVSSKSLRLGSRLISSAVLYWSSTHAIPAEDSGCASRISPYSLASAHGDSRPHDLWMLFAIHVPAIS
jgi:hypothetical protein